MSLLINDQFFTLRGTNESIKSHKGLRHASAFLSIRSMLLARFIPRCIIQKINRFRACVRNTRLQFRVQFCFLRSNHLRVTHLAVRVIWFVVLRLQRTLPTSTRYLMLMIIDYWLSTLASISVCAYELSKSTLYIVPSLSLPRTMYLVPIRVRMHVRRLSLEFQRSRNLLYKYYRATRWRRDKAIVTLCTLNNRVASRTRRSNIQSASKVSRKS